MGRYGIFREKRGFRELCAARQMGGILGLYLGGERLECDMDTADRSRGVIRRVSVFDALDISRERWFVRDGVYCAGYAGFKDLELIAYGFGTYGYGHAYDGMNLAIVRAIQAVDGISCVDTCHL
jgi:hypothetical protein